MTTGKRMLLLVMVLAVLMSTVPAAFAEEEITEKNTYVLQRASGGTEPNVSYASPYSFDYTYNGTTGWKTVEMFSMYNTFNEHELIPTYCLDMTVEAKPGVFYHRMNLEDSSYAASVAGRIRAIMLEGFYITNPGQYSDADHQTAINSKVSDISAAANAKGFAVTNLTMGEAMSATQLAIWEVIHGEGLSFPSFARTYVNSSMSGVKYGTLCKEELISYQYGTIKQYYSSLTSMPADMAARIPKNISTIYNYLLSLDPVPATSKVVSPSSFIDLNDPVLADNGDGTYDISVDVTVDVQMAAGDTLTLKADLKGYQDEQQPSASLTGGTSAVTLTIEDVPAAYIDGEVTLSVSGYQTGNGVFMFDAEDERGSSQTMVAMDNSRLPVYAEVVAQEERSLNIQKTSTGGAPLEGIIFDIYHAATMEEYQNGFDISNPTIRNDLAEYSVITNEEGYAVLNFTRHGLEDGVYLVVEREHPNIVKPIDPFYLILPMTNTDGTGYDYEIWIYPKNELKYVPIPTGGINLMKVDSADSTLLLSGAVFEVYRKATQEETTGNAEGLTTIDGVTGSVIKVPFFDNAAMTGEKVTAAATGEDGKLSIYGLTYGDYYLVETKAPEGYNLMDSPMQFTINANSHTDENVLTVQNVSGAILPETGGIGTTAYTLSGMLLAAVSIMMLLDRKHRSII